LTIAVTFGLISFAKKEVEISAHTNELRLFRISCLELVSCMVDGSDGQAKTNPLMSLTLQKHLAMKLNLSAIFGLICMFLNTTLNAQACGISVSTNLTCTVKVDIVVYYSPPGTCPACNTIQTNIVIAANGTYPIDCSGCSGTLCNILVTVTEINGTAITPVSYAMTSGTGANSLPPNCSAKEIRWDGSNFKINKL
jgi:hypothetical protein